MTPYGAPAITKLLRGMSSGDLAKAAPRQFQTWPAAKITASPIILEIIAYERARRGLD